MAHRARTPVKDAHIAEMTPHIVERERPMRDARTGQAKRSLRFMSDAEIESLIANLRDNRIARTHGEPERTNAAEVVREMRDERAREIDRRVGSTDSSVMATSLPQRQSRD